MRNRCTISPICPGNSCARKVQVGELWQLFQ
eukprot:SAG22_NODE_129_length_18679_cov_40.656028_21_plen_30_part_01